MKRSVQFEGMKEVIVVTNDEAMINGNVDGPAANGCHDEVHTEVEEEEEGSNGLQLIVGHGVC